jgi:PAS domain S-box-containing protein
MYIAGFPSAEARPQSIKVVTDNNYPPYVFYDSAGKLQGILIDQWRMWEQKSGITVEIHAMDWGKAISGMKAGEFDVIDTIFKTEERSGWLDFSRPYADIEVPIFFDKDISGITDAASLKGFPVAAKTGDAAVDLLKRNGVDNLMLFNSYEAVIVAAKEHRVSVFVVDAPPAHYFLYKLGIHDQYKQSAPLNVGQFHRAVKKGNRDLLKVVEDGFGQIPTDELKKIETKWYGSSLYDSRLPHYILIIAGGLAFLTFVLFAWNRVLRKTVAARTAALKTSVKELQALSIRQDAILTAVPDVIMEVDTNKVYTWANRAGLEFFGEDVVGKEATSYFEGEQNTYDAVQPLFEGEVAVLYIESWQKRKDGETRLLAWWCRELRDDQGNVTGAISTARDITEHRRSAVEIRESEERFRAIFERSTVGKSLTAPDGKLLRINNALADMLGYAIEEVQHRNFAQITHPDDMAKSRECIRILLAGEQADYRMEKRYIHKSGDIVWADVGTTLLRNEQGTPLYFITSIVDVSERKQADAEKMKLQTQLLQAQKMEAIGTLAGGIAHDFNNILSAVIGYTELAQMKIEADSEIKNYLNGVLTAGVRAKDLVKQILEFSRQTQKEQIPVLMSLIVKETLRLIRSSLPATIDIRQNIQSQSYVLSDPTRLHQIVMNLCTNAAHAMREKGGILEAVLTDVEIDADFCSFHPQIQPGAYQKLTVSDTGQGMTSDVMNRIFDPFFTTKPKDEGTGLGLSVVHGIVKDFGGTITVCSEPGKGTSFNLYFPIIEGRAEEKPEDHTTLPAGTERILVVDDEKDIINIIKKIFTSLGYAVEARTSSLEALALFEAMPDKFDLVISDMTMPQMTGDMLARELIKIRPDLPVILCTGFSENISKEKAATMGIKAFLMKPLRKEELAHTIRKVLDEAAL